MEQQGAAVQERPEGEAATAALGQAMVDFLEPEPVVVSAAASPSTAEEVAQAEADEEPEAEPPVRVGGRLPKATSDRIPPWVKLPEGFRFPRNRAVAFLFFHAHMTDTPGKGDRQAIVWSLDPEGEKMAFGRALSDVNRAPAELSKQMVRAVDGHAVDWSGLPGAPGNVDVFWRDIGPKYRDLIQRVYVQLHVLTREETDDFFENCVALRYGG